METFSKFFVENITENHCGYSLSKIITENQNQKLRNEKSILSFLSYLGLWNKNTETVRNWNGRKERQKFVLNFVCRDKH